MIKAYALVVLATVLGGCAPRAMVWKGEVQWLDDYSGKNVVPFMEAGPALAAAAAIREMVRTNPFPRLFEGCASPEQGLDVAVYTGPTPGLFYVLVDQRFDRCGGPRVRVLDGWYEYAVTPQGDVVAEAPPTAGDAPPVSPPTPGPPPPEAGGSAPVPAAPPTPSPPPGPATLPPSTGASTTEPAPVSSPSPSPGPVTPPPTTPSQGHVP
jgi:hypothetical protein